MPADLMVEPWTRLSKLSPPDTTEEDMQIAADRYALTADLYAALADLWEDSANTIDIAAIEEPGSPSTPSVSAESVTQDGISRSVTYASTPVVDTHASRVAQFNTYMNKARHYRARAKVRTAKLDGRREDFFNYRNDDPENVIPVVW